MEPEEIDFKQIRITRKVALVMMVITLLVLFLYLGYMVGYKTSYRGVNDYYKEYIDKFCFCKEPEIECNTPYIELLSKRGI